MYCVCVVGGPHSHAIKQKTNRTTSICSVCLAVLLYHCGAHKERKNEGYKHFFKAHQKRVFSVYCVHKFMCHMYELENPFINCIPIPIYGLLHYMYYVPTNVFRIHLSLAFTILCLKCRLTDCSAR